MSNMQYEVIIDESHDGERIDKALASIYPERSRSYFQQVVQMGLVQINGHVTEKAKVKVVTGDVIIYEALPEEESEILPVDLPLEIVYQDSELAVINKARGMVVHPAAGHYDDTLVNALLFHLKDLSSINGVVRPGIVHRLDKDTSGLLVVAKTNESHLALSEQLQDKTLYREYLAIVHGEVKDDVFIVDMPIGRSTADRKKMSTREDGRAARTHVKVLDRNKDYTLLSCLLETGRTHQIRVHLEAVGYPIVGDPMYGRKSDKFGLGVQMLHARKLGLMHPVTNEEMFFEAPIPKDFADVLEKCSLVYRNEK